MSNLSIIQSTRAEYPTPLGAKHAEFLLAVAGKLGYGLYRKSGGTTVTMFDGTTVSQDIVVAGRGGAMFDILSDGEGLATPVFNPSDPTSDPDKFYAVAATGGADTGPIPSPPDSSVPHSDPNAVLAKLDEAIAAIKSAQNLQQLAYADQINRLQAITLAIPPPAPRSFQGSIFGVKFTITAT